MTRRETYPCASLESVIHVTSVVKEDMVQRSNAVEYGVTQDTLRLSEILGFIEGIGSAGKSFRVTQYGEQLLSFPGNQQKIMLFRALLKENEVLPPYFKKLLQTPEINDKKLSTQELCGKLNMRDLWSADILNEWCRYLGISKGMTKSEVLISSQKIAQIRKDAFTLAIQEEYARFAGSSRLVPVARLRREIKNSGILGPNDDFDEFLKEISMLELNKDKITYHPAPSRFVGLGLQGKPGYELISIVGKLSS